MMVQYNLFVGDAHFTRFHSEYVVSNADGTVQRMFNDIAWRASTLQECGDVLSFCLSPRRPSGEEQ